ncbi:MAG: hypothetical protein LBV20_02525, partial [Treponema sp.]|nr:hypothetical protein [Treponema sp.]
MFTKTSLRFKIAVSIIVYIAIIGVAGNLFLYFYLQEAVLRKTEQLDHDQEEAVRIQLEENFAHVFSLAVICAADPTVLQLVSRQDRTKREVIAESLNVQEQINAFLRVNPVNPYINKLILFNDEGLFVQAKGRLQGSPSDIENIRRLPLYTRFIENNLFSISGFSQSINELGVSDSYVLLLRIQGSYRNRAEAYLYIET